MVIVSAQEALTLIYIFVKVTFSVYMLKITVVIFGAKKGEKKLEYQQRVKNTYFCHLAMRACLIYCMHAAILSQFAFVPVGFEATRIIFRKLPLFFQKTSINVSDV